MSENGYGGTWTLNFWTDYECVLDTFELESHQKRIKTEIIFSLENAESISYLDLYIKIPYYNISKITASNKSRS
ncbi:MAG: hypothetical protein ACOC35_16250 [Promethearchaeia archaeon]